MGGHHYLGTALWEDVISQITNADNDDVPAKNMADMSTMADLNLEHFLVDSADGWNINPEFLATRDNAISSSDEEDVNLPYDNNNFGGDNGLERRSRASDSVTVQQSQADSPGNSSRTKTFENSPNTQIAENLESHQTVESITPAEENYKSDICKSNTYEPGPVVLGNGSYDNHFEQPESPIFNSQFDRDTNSMYPEEVTANGPIKIYYNGASASRIADREWMPSSNSLKSSNPSPFVHNSSDSNGYRRRHNRNGQAINSHHQGRNMRAVNKPQIFDRRFSESERHKSLARPNLPPIDTGYGGMSWMAPNDILPIEMPEENSLASSPNQSSVDHNTFVGQNPLVDQQLFDGILGLADYTNGVDDHKNEGFQPIYRTEEEFRNRKTAREASRVISDYPHGDILAQHRILHRLYKAFRNTVDVEDSEKVTAKFSDGSIPDEAIMEACWDIMLRCRDSQELKGILEPEIHKTKYEEKESFTERMNCIIETLRKSKAACKQAVAPSFLDRLADQPNDELKRKESNKLLNKRKTIQNKAGQKAIAHQYADKDGVWKGEPSDEAAALLEVPQARPITGRRRRFDDGDDYDDDDGDVTTSAQPSKRRRRR